MSPGERLLGKRRRVSLFANGESKLVLENGVAWSPVSFCTVIFVVLGIGMTLSDGSECLKKHLDLINKAQSFALDHSSFPCINCGLPSCTFTMSKGGESWPENSSHILIFSPNCRRLGVTGNVLVLLRNAPSTSCLHLGPGKELSVKR
jgi:hypothetical protein